MDKAKLKRILLKAGLSIMTEALEDPKALEEYLKGYLNDLCKKSDPYLFESQFESGIHLVKEIDPTHMELAVEFITENKLDISKLLHTLRTNMPRFNREWVMKWLKEEHEDFWMVMEVHPRKLQFEMWFADQVQEISNYLLTNLEGIGKQNNTN
jgi:hypothetical protein